VRVLILTSLFVVLIGFVVLYFINSSYSIPQVKISQINKDMTGKYVQIIGKVVRSYYKDGNIFLEVKDKSNSSISVFIYKNVAFYLPQKTFTGKTVLVTGIIQEYKDDLELVLKKPSDIKVLE